MSRHPSTEQLLRWFEYQHLPFGSVRDTSHTVHRLAHRMVAELDDGPELSAGLRHLLQAKDCFVRQAITDGEGN